MTQYNDENSVEGLRGGNLVSGIHSHVFHGDPVISSYIEKVMKKISDPIFRMIRRWVFEGELEDAHVGSPLPKLPTISISYRDHE